MIGISISSQFYLHVLTYGGRTLNEHEIRYSVTQKELTAVVHLVKLYKPYLLGHNFLIRTDHAAKCLENSHRDWPEQLTLVTSTYNASVTKLHSAPLIF